MSNTNKELSRILLRDLDREFQHLEELEHVAKQHLKGDLFWNKHVPEFMNTLQTTSLIAREYGLNRVLTQISTYSETIKKKQRKDTPRGRVAAALAEADRFCQDLLDRDDGHFGSGDIKAVWHYVQIAQSELKNVDL